MSKQKYLRLTWEQIYQDTTSLVAKLGTPAQWKGIIAVTRGGMIPAGIIAEQTGLRTIDTLCISSYSNEDQGELSVLKNTTVTDDGEGWLIVDDLTDSGNTFRAIREMLPKAHLACLYVKPAGQDTTDSWVLDVEQDCWIIFPWAPEGS